MECVYDYPQIVQKIKFNSSDIKIIQYISSISDTIGHRIGIPDIGAIAITESDKTYNRIVQYYLKGVAIDEK